MIPVNELLSKTVHIHPTSQSLFEIMKMAK